MPISSSPIQVLHNRNGVTTLFWEVDKSGSDDTKYWNLYWSNRFNGTYNLVKSGIANASGYSNRYVLFELDRSANGITKAQNYFLNLTRTNWSGVETPLNSLQQRIVYEDGVTISNRQNYHDLDLQDSGATDIDYVTPDVFDSIIAAITMSRDNTDPITLQVSLISAGADVSSLGEGEEVILDYKPNFSLPVYEMTLSQYFGLVNDRQIRFKTTGVSGGRMHVTINRKRTYLYSNAMI